jgi:fructose-specific component phosphotransferase system IIB-like protein
MTTQRSILSSAKQFLIETLENHAAQKWNFAIVQAVTAVELVLKERLARIHPALIFKNIDAAGLRDTSRSLSSRLWRIGATR